MVERVIRTTRHPKLPDTFERLRAQAEGRNATDPIQDWLAQTSLSPSKSYATSPSSHALSPESSNLPLPFHSTRRLCLRSRTVNASPLQPTHGNRLPHPPTSPLSTPPPHPPSLLDLNRKRKTPDSSDTNPRQSTRNKKNLQSKSADDRPDMRDKEDFTIRVSQKQRKVNNLIKKENVFNEEEEPSDAKTSLPSGRPLVKSKEPSNDLVFNKGFIKLPITISKPSKISSSSLIRSDSLFNDTIIINENERMKFLIPRITFKTLLDTNKSEFLTGKLQKLWQHIDWHERKVIPSAFKVGLGPCHRTIAMFILIR